MEKIVEVTKEELENGCKKKVFIDGEFIEVEIPKNSEDKTRIAVEVEDEDGKKKKLIIILALIAASPLPLKGEEKVEENFGMKPRKKGMKYHSPKKNPISKKFLIGGVGTIASIIIISLILNPASQSTSGENKKESTKTNKKQIVTCDYYFNENYESVWVPSQEFYYEFLFNEKKDKIESLKLTEKYKYNQGSEEERRVYNGNTYSVMPGGSDEEIKNTYYASCETCKVENGIMTSSQDMAVDEFLEYSNLRNDNKKTLLENLMDTFNIESSCEEGYYPFIPYTDTQAEYCPTENFKASCKVKDVDK